MRMTTKHNRKVSGEQISVCTQDEKKRESERTLYEAKFLRLSTVCSKPAVAG